MACGDVNTTLLFTEGGKTVTLHFDTNTPHPQTSEIRLQGTKGIYSGELGKVFIEGRSKTDEWEPLAKYLPEFQSALYKGFDEKQFEKSRGHGDGPTAPILWQRLIKALREGRRPDQDVYDACAWSVISPLTERSVTSRNRPIEFPDFTRGKYKQTPPLNFA
jgi:hypothetical protein